MSLQLQTLRELLKSGPSPSNWSALIYLFDHWDDGDDLHSALRYASAQVRHWPDEIRQPPDRWLHQWSDSGQPPLGLGLFQAQKPPVPTRRIRRWMGALSNEQIWRLAFVHLARSQDPQIGALLGRALVEAFSSDEIDELQLERLCRVLRHHPEHTDPAVMVALLRFHRDARGHLPQSTAAAAVRALIAAGDVNQTALETLARHLNSPQLTQRYHNVRGWFLAAAVAWGLQQHHGPPADRLLAACVGQREHDSLAFSGLVLEILARHGHNRATQLAVAQHLRSRPFDSFDERIEMLDVIVRLDIELALPLLSHLLKDANPRLRVATLQAVEDRGPQAQALSQRVAMMGTSDPFDWVRAAALRTVRAITHRGDPAQCSQILTVLKSSQEPIQWVYEELKQTIRTLRPATAP